MLGALSVIERIRAARKSISDESGQNPKKFVENYIKWQNEHLVGTLKREQIVSWEPRTAGHAR